MKTCFKFIRSAISAFLSLSLIIIISLGLYVYLASSIINTRESFKIFLEQTQITKNLTQNISSILSPSIPASTLEILTNNLNDEVVNQNVDALVNNIYDWIENKKSNLDIDIPLFNNKIISRQVAFSILSEITKNFPKCSKNYIYPSNFEEFTCQPSNINEQNTALIKIIDSQIQRILPQDIINIPIDIQTEKDIRHIFIITRSLQNVLIITILIITLLILIVTPIFPSGFKVAGTSLFAAAGFTLIINWILLNNQQIFTTLYIQFKDANLFSKTPAFLNSIINEFLTQVNKLALIILIAGVLLWIIYFVIKKYQNHLQKKTIQQLPLDSSTPSVNQ